MKPILVCRRPFLKITVYPNRVEVVKGLRLLHGTTTIPIRNIASVHASPFMQTLNIFTTDGRVYAYGVNFGAEAIKRAIEDCL